MKRATWMAVAAGLCMACAAKVPDLRRTSGVLFATDVGFRAPFYGDNELDHAEEALETLQGGLALGYRIRGVEAYAQLRAGETSFLGVEGLYRFEKAPFLLVGGGFGVSAESFVPFEGVYRDSVGLEFVLPRVDLRLPISPSWELSWTAVRLSYMDQRLIEDGMDEEFSSHGLALMSTVGLVARADRLWENRIGKKRRPLAPRRGGVTIDGSTWLALLTFTANERRDERIAGESAVGDDFVQRAAQVVRLDPGASIPVPWGFVEVGLPLSYYPVQARGGVGLRLAWRPKTADYLSMGAAVHWYPSGYLLAELPRIDLSLRASDAVDITLTPIALLLAFEPARDVWVEEGAERKMPYWGFTCGLGGRWTIPVRGRRAQGDSSRRSR